MILPGHGDADAGCSLDALAENLKRAINRLKNAFGDSVEIGDREDVFHKDSELVAADPCGRILRTQHSAEPLGDLDQQYVARGVA